MVIVGVVAVGALAAGSVLAVIAFMAEPPAHTATTATTASTGASPSSSAVVPSLLPPTGVTYRDGTTRITLAWTNPDSNLLALIVVSSPGGGAAERPYPALPPGTTSFDADVSPRVDYCFSVIAVYGGDRLARSKPVCTHRSTSPSPAA